MKNTREQHLIHNEEESKRQKMISVLLLSLSVVSLFMAADLLKS